MAQDIERLLLQMSADIRKLEQANARALQNSDKTAGKIEARFKRMNKNLAADFGLLGTKVNGALAGVSTAVLAREAQKMADSYTNLRNQLRQYEDVLGPVAQSQGRLIDTAVDARAALEPLGLVTASASRAARELHASADDTFGAIEAVAKGAAIANTGTAAVDGSMRQLGQALASPRVQLEEFNSIIEGTPRLAQAFADGIEEADGSVAKLRTLISNGKIAGKDLFQALLTQLPTLRKEFGETDKTIGGALTNLQTRLIAYVGGADESLSATQKLTGAIDLLADNFDAVAEAALILGAVLTSRFVGAGIGKAAEDVLKEISAVSVAASATKVRLEKELAQARTNLSQINAANAAALAKGDASGGAQAVVRATRDVVAAEAALARQTTVTNQVLNGMGVAAGVARRGFASLIGLLGGPIGATLTAVSIALILVKTRADEAREATDAIAQALSTLNSLVPVTADVTDDAAKKLGDAADETKRLGDETRLTDGHLRDLTETTKAQTKADEDRLKVQKALAAIQREQAIAQFGDAISKGEAALREAQAQLRDARDFQSLSPDKKAIARALHAPGVDVDIAKQTQEVDRLTESLRLLKDGLGALQSGRLAIPTAVNPDTKPAKATGTGTAGATKSVEELRQEGILGLARLKNDTLLVIETEKRAEILKRTRAYESAGLANAEARSQAEREVSAEFAEQERLRGVEQGKAGLLHAADLARLRGNVTLTEQIEDQLATFELIDQLVSQGLGFDEAAEQASRWVTEIRDANDELRITDRLMNDLDFRRQLAEARGDTNAAEAIEREIDLQNRIKRLKELGFSDDDAVRQARAEVAALKEAGLQGTFKQTFTDGVKAALNGDLGDFFRNWLIDKLTNAFTKALDSVANLLWKIVQDAFNRGDHDTTQNLFSAFGSLFNGGSRSVPGPVSAGMVYRVHKDETIVPRIPGQVVRGGGGLTLALSYAPQINAAGADPATVDRLARAVADDRAQLVTTIRQTVGDMVSRGRL